MAGKMIQDEIELEFIREFSVGGLTLATVSKQERSERLRLAVLKSGLKDQPFRDFGLSYREAFRLYAGHPLELRRFPLPPICHDLGEDDDSLA